MVVVLRCLVDKCALKRIEKTSKSHIIITSITDIKKLYA